MPISVSIESKSASNQGLVGVTFVHNTLLISGLSIGANSVPHGLPRTPARLNLRPGANGKWGETQAPDATNLYITVLSGGATAGRLDVEYEA